MKDIYQALDAIDHHGRAMMAKGTELRAMLAALRLPEEPDFPCPTCGVNTGGERALAFHIQNVHDGPEVPLSPSEESAA